MAGFPVLGETGHTWGKSDVRPPRPALVRPRAEPQPQKGGLLTVRPPARSPIPGPGDSTLVRGSEPGGPH